MIAEDVRLEARARDSERAGFGAVQGASVHAQLRDGRSRVVPGEK